MRPKLTGPVRLVIGSWSALILLETCRCQLLSSSFISFWTCARHIERITPHTALGVSRSGSATNLNRRLVRNPPSIRMAISRLIRCPAQKSPKISVTLWMVERTYSQGADQGAIWEICSKVANKNPQMSPAGTLRCRPGEACCLRWRRILLAAQEPDQRPNCVTLGLGYALFLQEVSVVVPSCEHTGHRGRVTAPRLSEPQRPEGTGRTATPPANPGLAALCVPHGSSPHVSDEPLENDTGFGYDAHACRCAAGTLLPPHSRPSGARQQV